MAVKPRKATRKKKRKPGAREAGTLAVTSKLQKKLLLKLEQELYEIGKKTSKRRGLEADIEGMKRARAKKKAKPTKATKASVKKQGKELFDKPKKKAAPKKVGVNSLRDKAKDLSRRLREITKKYGFDHPITKKAAREHEKAYNAYRKVKPRPLARLKKPKKKKAAAKPKTKPRSAAQKRYFDIVNKHGKNSPEARKAAEALDRQVRGKKAAAKPKPKPKPASKKTAALIERELDKAVLKKREKASKYNPKPKKKAASKKKPAAKKASPAKATKKGVAPKPKKIPRSGGRLEKAVRGVGRRLLHGKSLARVIAKAIPGLGTAATVYDISEYLKDRYKTGIASGRIKKPTLQQIREARKKAKAEGAKKKKIKPAKNTEKKTKRKRYYGKFYKMKPMTIKARKKYEIIGGEPMKKPKKKKKKK